VGTLKPYGMDFSETGEFPAVVEVVLGNGYRLENRGWDDDPDWVLVCECGWEAWNGDSEGVVRHMHSAHAREHGYVTQREVADRG